MRIFPGNGRRACWMLALLALAGAVSSAPALAAESAPIKKGGVRFYATEKRVEIDGKFVLAEGPIELLACAAGGKEYESVISLDVNPEILHFCLLLLKLKPGDTGPKFQGDPDRPPTGSPVIVTVKWKDEAGEKTVRAEQLCWNAIDRRPMKTTPWVFAGSKKQKHPETGREIYWANIEKTVIAVFRDPFAVLDLPLALGANDEAYVVNKRLVPKRGTPCTMILTPGPEIKTGPKNAAGANIVHVDVTAGGRVLVDGGQAPLLPAERPGGPGEYTALVRLLEKRAKDAPKETYRVTVDHGCPPEAAATALAALDAAGVKLQSVETVRIRPGVKDAVTVIVKGDALTVSGVDATGLTEDKVKAIIESRLAGGDQAGVVVDASGGTSLQGLVKALRACEGVEGAVLRVTWKPENRPVPK